MKTGPPPDPPTPAPTYSIILNYDKNKHNRIHKELYQYGFRFLRSNFPNTEDIPSTVLLALALALRQFNPLHHSKASFKTFYKYKLLAGAKFSCASRLNFQTISLSYYQESTYLQSLVSLQEDPFPSLLLRLDLQSAFSILPPLSRRIVINHLILNHSLKEISIFLSIPYHIVRLAYNNSIPLLQDYLGDPFPK